MSALPRPTCGALEEVLSILVTITGWSWAALSSPVTSRPVSGQVESRVEPPATAWGEAVGGGLLVVTAAPGEGEGGGREGDGGEGASEVRAAHGYSVRGLQFVE